MPKLILVDAHGYLHRAFHALPPLKTSKGEQVNAVLGFTRMVLKLLQEYQPEYVAVCFDSPGPTFRHKIYPEYKATRKETDENLRSQFPLSREIVKAMGLASFEVEGFEADDLIATIAFQSEKQGLDVVAVSGDKDILQIVNSRIKVLNEPKKILFDPKKVIEEWGIPPEQITDVFALMGDASDNIPGVPGIGEKTAVKLIQDHQSVENLLKNPEGLSKKLMEKITQNREQMIASKKLCILDREAPIQVNWDDCRFTSLDAKMFIPILKKLEFHRLVTELLSKGVLSTPKEDVEKFSEKYQTILTREQLDSLVQTLKPLKKIAVDVETTGLNIQKAELVGISISWEKEQAVYIPLRHRYLGVPQQLPVEEVLNALKPILTDPSVEKVGQNLKFDFSILVQAGIRMKNLSFDTMIASYCLDPSKNSHRLKDLVPEFLGRNMTRIEELSAHTSSKSGVKEMAMDLVEIEKVSPYACADADCTLQLAERLAPLLKEKKCEELFYKIEMPLVEILADMEMAGIKVDIPSLENLKRDFSREMDALEKKAYQLAGQEFNLNSPKQLAFILFEKLNLPAVKKNKTGHSTNEEVLTFLSASHELPQVLLKHRELAKLNSTYIDGLLSQVQLEDSRVHTSFRQAATATGRLSSIDPNLQNIPIRTEHGRMIRRAFVPEEGSVFLSADYSQIDLRVLAHLSQDPILCKAFREGADIHRATASEVFHVPPEQVTEEERKKAKAINFGIVYGQQSFGLSHGLGISIFDAKEMIDKYFIKYAGIKGWIEKIKAEAKTDGYVKTLLGRIRYIPEMNSPNGSIRGFAERTAVNTPVQGTSADIIKVAMNSVYQTLKREDFQPQCKMLLQVHDDLLFEVKENRLRAVAEMVKDKMENAIQLSVPILVDLKAGRNWADMTPYSIGKP